jgi:adenylate cyclase
VLAEFAAASAATGCALEIQRVLAARNEALSADRRMVYRIGLHVGEVLVDGDRLYGDGINVAARLEALAEAGGVVCSSALRDQVRGLDEVAFDDLGPQRLKNIPAPVSTFRVRLRRPEEERGDPGEDESPSLAVLPFENRSDDAGQQYFADGISEELITELSRIAGLHVIARTSAFSYRGRALRTDQIGRELGVRYLVEGSVRRAGKRVRISAQLVEAANGRHVWAERFDRELVDLFALQDEVVREIVSALSPRLAAGAREPGEHEPTGNLEAYDLFLRAVSYMARFDRDSILRARALLERAVHLDPEFALAWSQLGGSYTAEHAFWPSEEDLIGRAEELIRKAIALRPDEASLHTDLSRALWFQGRAEESLLEAERALERNPGAAEAWVMLAHARRAHGRFEEAVEPTERALRLDPLSVDARFERGSLRYHLGQHAEAESDLRAAIRQSPDFLPAHLILAACLAPLGRDEEGRAALAEVLRIAPDYSLTHMRQRVPLGTSSETLQRDLRRIGLPD